MVLFRLCGYLLALAGFCLLIVDGARSIAAGEIVLTPLAIAWDMLGSGLAAEAAVGATGLWEPVIAGAAALPAVCVAFAAALSLVLLDAAIGQAFASLRRLPLRRARS